MLPQKNYNHIHGATNFSHTYYTCLSHACLTNVSRTVHTVHKILTFTSTKPHTKKHISPSFHIKQISRSLSTWKIKLSRFPSLGWSLWHELWVMVTLQWSLWTGRLLPLLGLNRCWTGVSIKNNAQLFFLYYPGMEWLPLTLRSGRSTRHLLL